MLNLTISAREMGEDRERQLVRAWMFHGAAELFARMGLGHGWWCAVDVPRTEIFGDGAGGDVDLLAGPLVFNVTPEEWQDRYESVAKRIGPQFSRAGAEMEAAQEGLVIWPPKVKYTIAVEVKASFFDGDWHSTHTGKRAKLRGSLKARLDYGINARALVHLGVTIPTAEAKEMDRLMDGALDFPTILEPADLHGAGYAIGMMGVVLKNGQVTWGGIDGLDWRAAPEISSPQPRDWHATLARRFALMPKPRSVRTYIHHCPHCANWMHAGSADPNGFACSTCAPTYSTRAWATP